MPSHEYNHLEVEKKWQNYWEKNKTFAAHGTSHGERSYVLDMFPYPSAQGLHVGHVEGYSATDIYCRYLRMNGKNVLHPMGWDAFGLPAENYAIKTGRPPQATTSENITNIRRQLKSLGLSYDWSREVNTSTPEYYKWTQWLFLKLYNQGLAYQKEAPVNWCPSCQTVLANEQVINGTCERCHSAVEQRQMKQWFFKITDYADRLLKNLKELDWPQPILEMQKNWIGESEGALVKFPLVNIGMSLRAERSNLFRSPRPAVGETRDDEAGNFVEIFTTRLDTIFGATFLVLSPELAQTWITKGWQTSDAVKKYVTQALVGKELERLERAAKDKTGVDTGVKAVNPATNEEIPVWVANYVLGSYGTGAIMAVPAHDERDFAFAKKFNLPVRRVVEPKFVATTGDSAVRIGKDFAHRNAVCAIVRNPKDDTYLCVSWKEFLMHGFITGGVEDGEDIVAAAKREIHEETGYKNVRLIRNPKFALHSLFYHRVKKQNRWARFQYLFFELENEDCDTIPAPEAALHDILWKRKDELKNFFSVIEGEFTMNFLANPDYIHTGEGLLHDSGEFDNLESVEAIPKIAKKIGAELKTQYRLRDWLISRQRYWGAPIPIIHCAKCGAQPVPEKDLPVELPNDVDFRPTGESPLVRSKSFHNVNCPRCGQPARRESDTMDTFVDSSWYWLRYCDYKNNEKAFDIKKINQWCPVNLYVGGAEHAVLHLLYARFITKVLKDLKHIKFDEPFLKLKNQGLILAEDGQKMSKSRGNVVNPDEIVSKYGADTLRIYEMFMGPLEDAKPWNTNSIVGVRRFLERVWKLADNTMATALKKDHVILLDKVTKKVTEDIENFKLNTALAALMELSNDLAKIKPLPLDALKRFLILLYPLAPHICSEMWANLGSKKNIWEEPWPKWDAQNLVLKEVSIVVQINGTKRSIIKCAAGSSQKTVQDLSLADAKITSHLSGRPIKRAVFIKDKLINLVVD